MSGRKNALLNTQFITNASMSGNITSKPIEIQFLDNVAISLQFPVNASATGNFYVDISNDSQTWIPISFGTAMSIPDTDNAIQIEATELAASYLRVRYVFLSGTGTLNGFISAKEI